MVGRLAVSFGVALSSVGTPAHAQRVAAATQPTLTWNAPTSCPDAESLRIRIERRLERSLDDVSVPIEVDVTLASGRYLARVDLRALTVANDVRTLTSKRCSELADAVAVIVARVASEAIARRRVALREESEPMLVDRIEPVKQGPPPPRPWAIGIRLSGINGIGVIPKVGLGVELTATVRVAIHLAELGGSRWVASAAQFHDGAPAEVDIDLDAAIARYGWRPAHMPLRAWVALEVGHMYGSGIALPSQQIENGRWIAAGTGFGVAWQMTPLVRLVGSTETMLALERVRFSLGDGIVVYAPSPMSVRTTVGLEFGWQ